MRTDTLLTHPRRALAATAVLALGLTACGAEVTPSAESAGSPHYPVTVDNCGTPLTYHHKPARVVTNDIGITELMLSLGLADRMAGYVMPDEKGDLAKVPWAAEYDRTKWLSKKEITKELVLDAKADLVFAGWNYGWNDTTGLTPEGLGKLGVGAYTLTESCRNGKEKARGVMPPLDALYADLANLGKIFDVEPKARQLTAEFQAEVAGVEAGAPARRPSVFLYDSGQDKPFTAGRFAAPEQIIGKAGGRNVMGDLGDSWTTVGWESVVARDPEVIVINNYGETGADAKRQFLRSYPPLANVSAVRNDRIFVLDYVDLVESPRNPSAISRLAAYLRTVPAP
ncbi:ABC transporter substrate-binding protein [Kitasatospora sp. NBC_00070]|uniref:ABC transporter substrate-binding protein n=1 Tax=Kitasatospora sp. NBC_00070 TaxID=2975962 RepID=UPI003860169A